MVRSDDRIHRLCGQFLQAVKAPFRQADRTPGVGLSIGVAVSPTDATTAEELLRCADIALCRTKRNRDGYSRFTPSMGERPGGLQAALPAAAPAAGG